MLRLYVHRLRAVPVEQWATPSADGKWSPAQEALHVAMANEIGVAASAGGVGMRLVAPPAVAWLSRTVLLPLLLLLGRFPRNAPAPQELLPTEAAAAAFSRDALIAWVQEAADRATHALREADDRRPAPHVVHAYFGPLRPLAAFRLLSAHTRHHARVGRARLNGLPARRP